ncbi:hypothetical protein AVEN_250025-1 [Araneus ventricosus]|uniref:Uncharacterized protein n=1 Tax=Araneus ventricosus TaxID=182803 RepID=A0A4Y2JZA4_ARAVE|nr:hypothetical protein AVEN_250025-1 [Araneus ventricosus]
MHIMPLRNSFGMERNPNQWCHCVDVTTKICPREPSSNTRTTSTVRRSSSAQDRPWSVFPEIQSYCSSRRSEKSPVSFQKAPCLPATCFAGTFQSMPKVGMSQANPK